MPSSLTIDERLYRARALYEAARRAAEMSVEPARRSAHTRHIQSLLRQAQDYIICIVRQNTLWARAATAEQYRAALDLMQRIQELYPRPRRAP